MNAVWYYVLNGERQGPVEIGLIEEMLKRQELVKDDYVWTKGYTNWIRIKDSQEINNHLNQRVVLPPTIENVNLVNLDPQEKCLYIKIGMDRGMSSEVEYGPFSLTHLKAMFNEKRINQKTFIYTSGMPDWLPFGAVEGFADIFGDETKALTKGLDKRKSMRKPLIARMFIQKDQKLYEGVCRDISIGGMQVLLDGFSGKPGDEISLNVHPDNTDYHFTAAGTIVRMLDGGHGFSFRYVGLSPEAIKAINAYLKNGN